MTVEPLIYLQGNILEVEDARISPFDRGFLWGDGVYEVTACFDRQLYRLEDHIERLYRSLRYVRIDPGFSSDEICNETLRFLESTRERLEPGSMYRLGHWISRGEDKPSMKALEAGPATIMMFFRQIDTSSVGRQHHEGVRLSVTTTRRIPPECMETRAKITSKMNQILAELDAASRDSLSLMLDINGNVAENAVANIFIARDGILWTPPERNILEGVTRKVVFELCEKLSIPLQERFFTMYDLAQADEIFITSTPICATPVSAVDDLIPKQPIPGPITLRLINAFVEETGFDFRQSNSAD